MLLYLLDVGDSEAVLFLAGDEFVDEVHHTLAPTSGYLVSSNLHLFGENLFPYLFPIAIVRSLSYR